MKNVKFRGIPR